MNEQIFEIFWNFEPPGFHILTTFDTKLGRSCIIMNDMEKLQQ